MRFHKAIRQYGVDAFELRVLAENVDLDILSYTEVFFISKHDSIRNGYNVSPGGEMVSDDTKARISKSLKGRKFSAEHRRKLSESNKRREAKKTPEQRSEEARVRTNKMWAKGISEETREKFRQNALKRKPLQFRGPTTPEGKAKIKAGAQAAMSGIPKTESHKKALRKPKSEEGRKAILIAQQARRQREAFSRIQDQFNTQPINLN